MAEAGKREEHTMTATETSMQGAFAAVDANEGYLIKALQDLVAVDTSVPPGRNYDTIATVAEGYFHALGFATERVVIPEDRIKAIPLPLDGPRVNLLARRSWGAGDTASIYAHTDVVPIEEPWTEANPFGGEVKDGKLYGRGSSDMKGSIAALLTALKVIHDTGLTPHYDVQAMLCTDEEIGVYPGVWHLAKEGYVTPHIVWLECGGQMPTVMAASAGAMDVTVTVYGRSGHSGMNFVTINAIEEMVPILNALLVLKCEVEARRSRFPLPPMQVPEGVVIPDAMSPMFNLSIIKAGAKSNIVPGVATLTINRRFIPEEDADAVEREIREAIARGAAGTRALKVDVDVMRVYPAGVIEPDGPRVSKMKAAVAAVRGIAAEGWPAVGVSGSTDRANVSQEMGITDIASFGGNTPDNRTAHGANEYIRVDVLKDFTKEILHYLAF